MEHIEPECLDAVLDHIRDLSRTVTLLGVSMQEAAKTLPDGRNAHLIVEGPDFWFPKIEKRWKSHGVNGTAHEETLVFRSANLIPVMIGYDHRQTVSFHVLTHSLLKRSSQPLAITPLVMGQLGLRRVGLTPFTFSRFLVPELMKYEGWAVFMDIDMMARADIAELMALADDRYAVMVSKNELRFEWTSLMLMNCRKCSALSFDYVEDADGLHKMVGGFSMTKSASCLRSGITLWVTTRLIQAPNWFILPKEYQRFRKLLIANSEMSGEQRRARRSRQSHGNTSWGHPCMRSRY